MCQRPPRSGQNPPQHLGLGILGQVAQHVSHPVIEVAIPVIHAVGKKELGDKRCADEPLNSTPECQGAIPGVGLPQRLEVPFWFILEGDRAFPEALDRGLALASLRSDAPTQERDDAELGGEKAEDTR